MRLNRAGIALYVGLIFASGVAIGAFGHRLYTANSISANTTRNPEEWRKRYMSEMTSRLGLRHEQVTKLNTILDETRARFQEVHEKSRPEMEAIRKEQIQRIRAILDGAQQVEYEKMREERERRTGGKPPGGPGL